MHYQGCFIVLVFSQYLLSFISERNSCQFHTIQVLVDLDKNQLMFALSLD